MKVVLCRHGVTDANAGGAILSRRDPPLSALGREQSERAHASLQSIAFDRAFCSPMRRCVETLTIVAPTVAYRCDPGLREVDFGQWEGRTLEWLEANEATSLAQRRRDPVNFRPPGGESFADASERLRSCAEAIRNSNGRNVLVVAHRGSLGVLERLLRGLPLASQEVTPLAPAEFRALSLP